eukprot:365572-Chlamydomonas_euryale.AAC.2
MGYVLGVHGTCMGPAWEVHEMCMGCAMDELGTRMRDAREPHGTCMGRAGLCIGCVWDLHGTCKGPQACAGLCGARIVPALVPCEPARASLMMRTGTMWHSHGEPCGTRRGTMWHW